MKLGNLSIMDVERRLNITLSDANRDKLESMRQIEANDIQPGKWHCFDIPFQLVCGNRDTAVVIRDILALYEGQMKGDIQIGWV